MKWKGVVECQHACVVRSGASLDSEWLDELPPQTVVLVVEEQEASGRLRLRLSEPLDGWVTAKYVRRSVNGDAPHGHVEEDWKPLGEATFFPDGSVPVTDKTPMGYPVDIFRGQDVDLSFGSPAAMYRDKVEVAMWIARRVSNFKDSLGEEVNATLLSDAEKPPDLASRRDQRSHRPQVLYIAGVEGTGHHGVMPMILYPAVRQYGSCTLSWWRSLREVLMKVHPRQRRQRLKALLEAMHVFDKPHFIMEWASWPFGEHARSRWSKGCDDPHGLEREERSGNPGNSVDLLEFVELFRDFADVKVLVLHRNLLSAAWSHKEWDDGLVEHAKVLALFNDYLTKVLGRLDPSMWRWVSYEELSSSWSQKCYDEVGQELGDFLGLKPAALSRAFRYFKPSRKDAASEMTRENLRLLQQLEARKGRGWFPEMYPQQQLLKQFAATGKTVMPKEVPPPEDNDAFQAISQQNPAFQQLWETLSASQRQVWSLVDMCSRNQEVEKLTAHLERFSMTLSEDQRFMLHKAMLREKVGKRVEAADVDFSAFSCVHFWIEDRGFGSEVNNLVSAAIACEEHGIACVVEDEVWNSGRLHTYLQAEPLILRRCPKQLCRPCEVRRDRRVATPGWFAVCKHASNVSFARKSKYMRRIWRYTNETQKRIDRLNEELNLPEKYIAVQIRRGDKVAGNRKESVEMTGRDFAQEALKHVSPGGPTVIIACSDDRSAAEELGNAVGRRAEVRWRKRQDVPENLRNGHWQADYNALSAKQRVAMTHEFLADVEVLRKATLCVCTFSSNVGRLVALLRDGPTVSMDIATWTND